MGQRLDRACVRMGADMKIESGKYYRTRGGQVFGPMVRDEDYNANFPWCLVFRFAENCWAEDGRWHLNDEEYPFDLVAEVYVSDTPPAFMRLAKTPSDDTVVSFNFSQMARDGRKWATGSIGFWIGDEMRTAHYDVHIGGVEGKAWPSDVPNPWRDKRGLPAPAPEAKTLRDEFAMRLMDWDAFAGGYKDEAEQLYRAADAMMEARKK